MAEGMRFPLFYGASNAEQPPHPDASLRKFDLMLSDLVENPKGLNHAAHNILAKKEEIAQILPESSVIQDYKKAVERFLKNPSHKTFDDAVAYCLAVAEPTFLAPGQKIQPSQVEAIVSLVSSHSTQVPQGEGKSTVIVPTAAVLRSQLFGEQVHLIVINPQIRQRDSAHIAKLTDKLSMSVETLGKTNALEQDREALWKLQLALRAVDFVKESGEQRNSLKESIRKKIVEITSAYNQAEITRTMVPEASSAATEDLTPQADATARPDIVVGTDSDFVFDYLRDPQSRLWLHRRHAIVIDGDLVLSRATPYIVEAPPADFLEAYLSDWIGAVASMSGTVFSAKRFRSIVKKVADTGKFPKEYSYASRALRVNLAQILSSLPYELNLKVEAKDIKHPKKLIQDAARSLWHSIGQTGLPEEGISGNNIIEGYRFTAKQVSRLVRGGHFQIDPFGRTVVINPDTGHPLPGHKYQGLLDVMISASQKTCNIHPQTDRVSASTGFASFIRRSYEPGTVALTSGTLEPLAREIQFVTGKPVVEIESWRDTTMRLVDLSLAGTDKAALQTLLKLVKETTRPVLIVAENDEEVEWLHNRLGAQGLTERNIQIVTSLTDLTKEENIIKNAGGIGSIVISNPRLGRDTNVELSDEARKRGGLRVVAWGMFGDASVVEQIWKRAGRANDPGEAHWIAYKRSVLGGTSALLDNPQVIWSKSLKRFISRFPKGTVPADNDLAYKLFEKYREVSQAGRNVSSIRDTIQFDLEWQLRCLVWGELTRGGRRLATYKYIKQFVRSAFGERIVELSDILALGAAYFGHGSLDTEGGMVTAMANTRVNIDQSARELMRDKYVNHVIGNLREQLNHHYLSILQFAEDVQQDNQQEPVFFRISQERIDGIPVRLALYSPLYPLDMWEVLVSRPQVGAPADQHLPPSGSTGNRREIFIIRTTFNKRYEVERVSAIRGSILGKFSSYRTFLFDFAQCIKAHDVFANLFWLGAKEAQETS